MPANGDGTGQVPPTSSPDSNGQVPPESHSQSSTSAASDNGANTTSTANGGMTLEQALDALKKAREDAAKRRVDDKELADLRAFKQQADEANLSADEKRDRALAEAQQRAADAETRAQGIAIRAETRSVARELGINPELALKLLDATEIEFNDDGDPTNIGKLLAAVVEKYGLPTTATATATATAAPGAPGQPGQQPASSTAAAPAMGATNPPRGSQVAGPNGAFARGEYPRTVLDGRLWSKRGN